MNELKYTPSNGSEANAIPEYALAAAKWWTKSISSPKFDNGDTSKTGDIGSLLAMMLSAKNPVSHEQAETFKIALAKLIADEVNACGSCYVSVDYHPDHILCAAAKEAGLENTHCFSWKTSMRITKDEVRVSAGYAKPYVVIWAKDE